MVSSCFGRMLSQRKNKNLFGFTLIELMVSISIIAIISSMYLVNYRSANKATQLSLAMQKLSSDIRLAQNYSLGLVDFNGEIPEGGWGVHFNQGDNFYTIFADSFDDTIGSYTFDDSSEEFRKINLPKGVSIDSIAIGDTPDMESSLDIVFLPPNPTTYINGVDNTKAKITLKNTDNNTSDIEVNFFGLIDILD